MSVLFPNFWDIQKKKGIGPYQKLIDMVRCRQRPVSERYDYNNKRLSRTGKANTQTPSLFQAPR